MIESKVGEINYNNQNLKMIIINYRNIHDIDVQFENGIVLKHKEYDSFLKGIIRNPYKKAIFDVGCIGVGKYTTHKNGKMTIQYKAWRSMLKRCYDEEHRHEHPTYKDCAICEEWHNFQNFAKWFNENYYEVKGQRMEVDKDILHKGNKIYSPTNCIIVPNRVNSLFVKNDADRGEYPIGVYYNKRDDKIISCCKNINNKTTYLGIYNTPEDAFYLGYKPFKEKLIKEVADLYKDYIPKQLYEAMMNWTVEIYD
jgi:hypothetical protein